MMNDRIAAMASDIYDYAFHMVDAELEADGEDAGRIATAVQRAFEYSAINDDCEALAGRIILDAQRDGTLEYDIDVEQDSIDVRGNAMCSGDDDFDHKVENDILERLASGDNWAWASVKMTCRVPGYDAIGIECLSGCSYASRADFEKDAYYDDMRTEARHGLQSALVEELA